MLKSFVVLTLALLLAAPDALSGEGPIISFDTGCPVLESGLATPFIGSKSLPQAGGPADLFLFDQGGPA